MIHDAVALKIAIMPNNEQGKLTYLDVCEVKGTEFSECPVELGRYVLIYWQHQ